MSYIANSMNYEVNWKPLIDSSKNKHIDKYVYFELIIKTWYFYNIAHPELDVDKKFIGVQNLKNCLDYILKVNNTRIFRSGYMIMKLKYFMNKVNVKDYPNFPLYEMKLLKDTINKESKDLKPVTFSFLKLDVKEDIYNAFINYWYDKKYNEVTIEMFNYVVKPLVLSKIKNPNSKIKMKCIYNRFKSWINFKAPDNEKVLAIKKSKGWVDTIVNSKSRNNSEFISYSEYSDEEEEVEEEEIEEDDEEEEEKAISVPVITESKKRPFVEDISENPKKKMKEDFDMLKKEFIKKLPFDKFNIIIKNGGYDLKTNKFVKPVDLNENDAIKLGVEMILKLSELGMVNTIIYN
jgi:hypothetical protein